MSLFSKMEDAIHNGEHYALAERAQATLLLEKARGSRHLRWALWGVLAIALLVLGHYIR